MFDWNNVNKVSSIVTIVAPVVTFFLGVKLPSVKRWYEFRKIKNKVPKNSGILIISIGNRDIENMVKGWLNEKGLCGDIPNDRILRIIKLKDKITYNDIDSIIKDIKMTKVKFQQKGIRKIHLFISSPLVISAMVGAEFSNNFQVFTYHYNFKDESGYEFWGTLQR